MSPDIIQQGLLGTNEVATAEEAFSISIRSTATLSQAFSLESIMALFAVVLLGTQVATLWPNFGVLSSLVPTIHPFARQSLQSKGCITEQGWRNLASLQTLEFNDCNGLTTLSDSPSFLRGLKSLTILDLVDCPELVWSAVEFQHLVALIHLTLEDLPQLTSLPDGIQHVRTLQCLYIRECKNLRMLPQWLLQQHLLPSLHYLEIIRCHPELHKRCEVDKGEDWRKISHLEVDNFE